MADSTVQVTVSKIDVRDIGRGSDFLVGFEDEQWVAYEAVRAWATVRGYDRLIAGIDDALGADPPKSGFAIVINKPHSLLLIARWPWCKDYLPDLRRGWQ